jgi:hypothetical protein
MAHISGIPVEETALGLAPVAAALLGFGAVAAARARKALRTRFGSPIRPEGR